MSTVERRDETTASPARTELVPAATFSAAPECTSGAALVMPSLLEACWLGLVLTEGVAEEGAAAAEEAGAAAAGAAAA